MISFSTPVTIAGKELPAGEYNLLSIPGKEQWSFILNQDTSLWGTYNYDSSKDMLEFDVLVEKQSVYMETMTPVLDMIPYDAVLYIMWEDFQVLFPIQTNLNEHIQDTLLTGLSTNAR